MRRLILLAATLLPIVSVSAPAHADNLDTIIVTGSRAPLELRKS